MMDKFDVVWIAPGVEGRVVARILVTCAIKAGSELYIVRGHDGGLYLATADQLDRAATQRVT